MAARFAVVERSGRVVTGLRPSRRGKAPPPHELQLAGDDGALFFRLLLRRHRFVDARTPAFFGSRRRCSKCSQTLPSARWMELASSRRGRKSGAGGNWAEPLAFCIKG